MHFGASLLRDIMECWDHITQTKDIESQFMRKFLIQQEIASFNITEENPLHSLLPPKDNVAPSILDFCSNSAMTLETLHMHEKRLESIASFANNGIVVPVPPYQMSMFDSEEIQQLGSLYTLIYQNKTVHHLPYSYQMYGRVNMSGEMIGSTLPGGNNAAASVIMAYWPTRDIDIDLSSINYQQKSVGVIQYFIKHLKSDEGIEVLEHIFAFVKWKKAHPNYDFYGCSAAISINMYESSSIYSFIPVQRIACRPAFSVIKLNIDHVEDSVFVTCPIPIKCYL